MDGAVGGGGRPVPELDGGGGAAHDEVDLAGDGRLYGAAGAGRHRAHREAVVGQRPAIVEDAVDAGAEAAVVGHVEGAVQRQVAGDAEQRRIAWRAERDVHLGRAGKGERGEAQRLACASGEGAAARDRGRAHAPGPAEGRAGIHLEPARGHRSVHLHAAAVDGGGAGEALGAGEGEGRGPLLDEIAGSGDVGRECAIDRGDSGERAGADGEGAACEAPQVADGLRVAVEVEGPAGEPEGRGGGQAVVGAKRQAAAPHGGVARIAALAGEGERAVALLLEGAGAGDGAAEGVVRLSAEDHLAVVQHVADQRAVLRLGPDQFADIEPSVLHLGAAGPAVLPGQREPARTGLHHFAGAGDVPGRPGEEIGAVEKERAVVRRGDGQDQVRGGVGGDLECGAAGDVDRAVEGSDAAGERCRARQDVDVTFAAPAGDVGREEVIVRSMVEDERPRSRIRRALEDDVGRFDGARRGRRMPLGSADDQRSPGARAAADEDALGRIGEAQRAAVGDRQNAAAGAAHRYAAGRQDRAAAADLRGARYIDLRRREGAAIGDRRGAEASHRDPAIRRERAAIGHRQEALICDAALGRPDRARPGDVRFALVVDADDGARVRSGPVEKAEDAAAGIPDIEIHPVRDDEGGAGAGDGQRSVGRCGVAPEGDDGVAARIDDLELAAVGDHEGAHIGIIGDGELRGGPLRSRAGHEHVAGCDGKADRAGKVGHDGVLGRDLPAVRDGDDAFAMVAHDEIGAGVGDPASARHQKGAHRAGDAAELDPSGLRPGRVDDDGSGGGAVVDDDRGAGSRHIVGRPVGRIEPARGAGPAGPGLGEGGRRGGESRQCGAGEKPAAACPVPDKLPCHDAPHTNRTPANRSPIVPGGATLETHRFCRFFRRVCAIGR